MINTQYMRNPDMVYVLKMEYVSKINIFCLKWWWKVKFLHAQAFFRLHNSFTSLKWGFRSKNTNSVIKITFFAHGGISKKNCGIYNHAK